MPPSAAPGYYDYPETTYDDGGGSGSSSNNNNNVNSDRSSVSPGHYHDYSEAATYDDVSSISDDAANSRDRSSSVSPLARAPAEAVLSAYLRHRSLGLDLEAIAREVFRVRLEEDPSRPHSYPFLSGDTLRAYADVVIDEVVYISPSK